MSSNILDAKRILDEVLQERVAQIKKGYDAVHDSHHDSEELSHAAAAYAIGRDSVGRGFSDRFGSATVSVKLWPFDMKFWKPRKRRDNLIRSMALLLAEIERIDAEKTRREDAFKAMAEAK